MGHMGVQWVSCPALTMTIRNTRPPTSTNTGATTVCLILWVAAKVWMTIGTSKPSPTTRTRRLKYCGAYS